RRGPRPADLRAARRALGTTWRSGRARRNDRGGGAPRDHRRYGLPGRARWPARDLEASRIPDPRRHLPGPHHVGDAPRRTGRSVRGGLLSEEQAPAARGAGLAVDCSWTRRVARVRTRSSLIADPEVAEAFSRGPAV